jgi:hypothetical protein
VFKNKLLEPFFLNNTWKKKISRSYRHL